MNIEQIEHGAKGVFVIRENNERLAEMTYSKAGDQGSSLIIQKFQMLCAEKVQANNW